MNKDLDDLTPKELHAEILKARKALQKLEFREDFLVESCKNCSNHYVRIDPKFDEGIVWVSTNWINNNGYPVALNCSTVRHLRLLFEHLDERMHNYGKEQEE